MAFHVDKPIEFSPFPYLDSRGMVAGLKQHISFSRRSLRNTARASGISASYLSEVLSGRKSLSGKVLNRLVVGEVLSAKGALYMNTLLRYEATDQPDERLVCMQQLNELGDHESIHKVLKNHFLTLKHWYVSSIRKLLQHPGVKGDIKSLQKSLRFAPDPKELREMLNGYEAAGLIERASDATWKVTKRNIKWEGAGKENVFLQHFHRTQLQLSIQALSDPYEDRDYQCMTFLCDPQLIPEMQASLDRFLTSFYKKFAAEECGYLGDEAEVFQLNTQLFKTSQVRKLQ